MRIHVPAYNKIHASPNLTPSKSESNRALIIKALSNEKIILHNLSKSDDTLLLESALNTMKNNSHFNCSNAGTTFRFLTAFLSTQKGNWTLSGNKRMHQRPISHLIDALNELGAQINYLEQKGFPPIKIQGNKLKGDQISIFGNVSSQFISALLLIAPTLHNGLTINIKGSIYSKPYIHLTLQIMNHFGLSHTWKTKDQILVPANKYKSNSYTIENDWSAASYWYSIASLSKGCQIQIQGLRKDSFQGDAMITNYYKHLGVTTDFTKEGILINKDPLFRAESFYMNLNDHPDLAQTLAVSCAGLGVECHLTGLETLLLKETNRLEALQNELQKLGVKSVIESGSIYIPGKQKITATENPIKTYGDHRMAMSFAPLSVITKYLKINDHNVVNKSYPEFWKDLIEAGFVIRE